MTMVMMMVIMMIIVMINMITMRIIIMMIMMIIKMKIMRMVIMMIMMTVDERAHLQNISKVSCNSQKTLEADDQKETLRFSGSSARPAYPGDVMVMVIYS